VSCFLAMQRNFTRFLKNIFGVAAASVFVLAFLVLTTPVTSAATNITSTAAFHWAWNDIVGWMDFYQGGNSNVTVASNATTTGYASSSARDISLDCATPRVGGSVCGTANYGVYNPGNGNLVGWAWNDVYGWISFCGGGSTAECPGTVAYEVLINTTTGDFSGYAWNDAVGWISFNCNDIGPTFCNDTSKYWVNTTWTSTSTSGYLDSSTYDTGVPGGAELNSVVWQGDFPEGTQVRFQIAASSSPSGPWNFVGYDGTENTYYPETGFGNPSSSIPLNYVLHNNQRYFRYRVVLVSNAAQTASPTVNDVIINWSP